MTTASTWAKRQTTIMEASWKRQAALLARLTPADFARRIREGWTIKEMLAHLAFWEETSQPVIETIFRGGPQIPAEQWYGGTDLELSPDDPWPGADVHNRREAKWARAQSTTAVLDRLTHARQQFVRVVATVTDIEATGDIGRHLQQTLRHTEQHLAEVEAMLRS